MLFLFKRPIIMATYNLGVLEYLANQGPEMNQFADWGKPLIQSIPI